MHFLIARTDNIGDVILTFPLVVKLKEYYPDAKVTMLARNYTQAIVERCPDIDAFLSEDDLKAKKDDERIEMLKALNIDVFLPIQPNKDHAIWMRKAGVPIRVGHIHRNYFLRNSNRLIWRIKRKRTDMHQVQLCFQYLKGLKLPYTIERSEMASLIRIKPFTPAVKAKALLDPEKFNLVLHPGTSGRNTLEWPKENFAGLMRLLPNTVKVFITGSAKEKERFGDLLANHPNAVGLFGDLNLSELVDFLSIVDGVVVGSTGPLHIAAMLGTPVIGLFPPQQDLDVKRWGGVGDSVINIEAPHCQESLKGIRCGCMAKITPEQIFEAMRANWAIDTPPKRQGA